MDAIHNLWSFIGSATQMTVIIPAVLAMVPWWRFSRRVMVAWAVGLEVLMGVMAWGIWALLGLGDLSVWLVGAAGSHGVLVRVLVLLQPAGGAGSCS